MTGTPARAILYVIFAAICFTGIDSCAKYLVQTLPTLEVVFIRYVGHFALICAVFLPREGRALWRTDHPWLEVWRGVLLFGSTILNFAALKHLPLAVTSSIFFLSPLIICIMSIPLLGEKVGPRRWAAVIVGFVGVLVIVRPGLGALHPAWILSIGAATCASLYMIYTRKIAAYDSTDTMQFYAAMVATAALAPMALPGWIWPSTGVEWLLVVLIGFLGWAGHQFITIAHHHAPASALAPFVYLQIVWMTASGYIFFGDDPDHWVFIGAGIVIASGLYIWMRERQVKGV